MTATRLPPGPVSFNAFGWASRPILFMEHCRRRYGAFSADLGPPEGIRVFNGAGRRCGPLHGLACGLRRGVSPR